MAYPNCSATLPQVSHVSTCHSGQPESKRVGTGCLRERGLLSNISQSRYTTDTSVSARCNFLIPALAFAQGGTRFAAALAVSRWPFNSRVHGSIETFTVERLFHGYGEGDKELMARVIILLRVQPAGSTRSASLYFGVRCVVRRVYVATFLLRSETVLRAYGYQHTSPISIRTWLR